MLTNDDLQQIGKLLSGLEERLTTKIETVDKKIETVDLKVEASHQFNKKALAQIMETLFDMNEINYKDLKKELDALKKRIEQLEGKQHN